MHRQADALLTCSPLPLQFLHQLPCRPHCPLATTFHLLPGLSPTLSKSLIMPALCSPGLPTHSGTCVRTDISLKSFLLRVEKRFPSHPSSQSIHLRKCLTVSTFSSFWNINVKWDSTLSPSSVGTWLQVAKPPPVINMWVCFSTALSQWRGLCNSIKLWAMPCRATQDGWVIADSSDKTWFMEGWQATPVYLPWEPHELYLKRYDTKRWVPQVWKCPICYWGGAEENH